MNPGPIRNVDFVEFWVGNAKIAAEYWCKTMGFQHVAIRGLKTGNRLRSSHAIRQGSCTFVFTTSMTPTDAEFYDYQKVHGDSVRDVAFLVDDVDETFARAILHGAFPLEEPQTLEDSQGFVRTAKIKTPFGDVVHSLMDRSRYKGIFLPGFAQNRVLSGEFGIVSIDHIAMAYPKGKTKLALDFYHSSLGFNRFLCNDDDTSQGLTILGMDDMEGGLKTIVAACNPDKYCFKFVLVEAIEGSSQNQVQEFLEFNGGHGVQHIALHTDDIFAAVGSMKRQGLEFLKVPAAYYETLFMNDNTFMRDRKEEMHELGLLLDVSEAKRNIQNGEEPNFFIQCFTLPIQDRPTFFLEVISRKGSSGFGKKTIKALFEAVEKQRRQRDGMKEIGSP